MLIGALLATDVPSTESREGGWLGGRFVGYAPDDIGSVKEPVMIRQRLIVLSGATILLGCDSAVSDRTGATRTWLVGTWLRETEASGQKMRRCGRC